MNTQPEALRLADELEAMFGKTDIDERVCKELRRLHEVNQMLVGAVEMALDTLEIYGAQAPAVNETIEALRQAFEQSRQETKHGAYAGVRIWIGDKTIQYSVTKVCIEQEMTEDLAMKLAFDSCLKALKEKNT